MARPSHRPPADAALAAVHGSGSRSVADHSYLFARLLAEHEGVLDDDACCSPPP